MTAIETVKTLSDKDFLTQLENKTLDSSYFNHIGHLRLTWLYLMNHDVETTVQLTSSTIRNYAESLGASTKFHITITDAIIRVMAKRVEAMEIKSWQSFLEQNTDLVEDAISVLTQHYSKDLLFSEEARVALVSPDIKAL